MYMMGVARLPSRRLIEMATKRVKVSLTWFGVRLSWVRVCQGLSNPGQGYHAALKDAFNVGIRYKSWQFKQNYVTTCKK